MFLEKIEIGDNSSLTQEGFLKAKAVLCKSGIVDYDGVMVFLPPEVLKKSAEDWNGYPLTFEHDFQSCTHNTSIGSVFNVSPIDNGEEVFLLGELLITDTVAIDNVLNGSYRALSIGFIEECLVKNGAYKGEVYDKMIEKIAPNHLAICMNGTARVEEARIVLSKNNKKENIGMKLLNFAKLLLGKSSLSDDEEEKEKKDKESVLSEESSPEEFQQVIVEILEKIQSLDERITSMENGNSVESEENESSSLSNDLSGEDETPTVIVRGDDSSIALSMTQKEIEKIIDERSAKKAMELSRVKDEAQQLGVSFSFQDTIEELKKKVIKTFLPSMFNKNMNINATYEAAKSLGVEKIKLSRNSKLNVIGSSSVENLQREFAEKQSKARDFAK